MGCICSSLGEDKKCIQKFDEKTFMESGHLEKDQGGGGNITLKWVSMKLAVRIRGGSN